MAAGQRLHELDGLRGLLALYVAVYHLAAPLSRPGMALAWLHPLLEPAWFAVDMFFVMSGFVMAHVHGAAFAAGGGAPALRHFFVARVARLVPVHFFALAVMAVGILPFVLHRPEFTSPDGRFAWTAGLASLLMLHGPWIAQRTWNYPAWSVSAEMHAYLVFPLVAPWVARLRGAGSVALATACVLVPFGVYQFGLAPETHPTNGLIVLARVLPLFVAGMAVHRLREAPAMRSTAVACAAFVLVPVLLLDPATSALAVLLAPVVLLSTLGHPGVRGVLSRPGPVWLGAISYSLYMTHALVEMFGVDVAVRRLARSFHIGIVATPLASAALLLVALGVAVLLGAATWRWIEVPGRRLVLRLLERRDNARAALHFTNP
ncbi:MAG: acyltransferase family protein [Vitreoscilla sp.]